MRIGERDVEIRYSWGAISLLRAQWGEGYITRMATSLESRDLEAIAFAIAAGSAGAVSAAEVLAESPPIVPAIEAVRDAWVIAHYGPEGFREPRPQKGGRQNRFTRFWRRLSGGVSQSKRSGG